MMKKVLTTLILSLVAVAVSAQYSISGKVMDRMTESPLIGATVALSEKGSNTEPKYTITDMGGSFEIKNLKNKVYVLDITYIGYKAYSSELNPATEKKRLEIRLKEDTQILDEVSINGRATRAEQKGDSLVYNAEAFKVMDGSNVEDLLSKMPGIVVEGGSIQAQGEDVKKVLVDGKEFFDGDINLAIKNLPSDVIASIEVFDKKSEQAEFTGFDDGESIKTINIITKTGYKQGTFGRITAGYGTDNRYNASGNINIFNDDRRFSLLGMSNNINSQNFSQEDIAGVMASSAQRRRPGGGQRGGMANNFMSSNLGGVTSTDGIGLNYTDKWGEKVNFTGSYFFNHTKNVNDKTTDRDYFDSAFPGMSYSELSNSTMNNFNHRINMKLDYNINRRNTLTIRPNISFQHNSSESLLEGSNIVEEMLKNKLTQEKNISTFAYNIGGTVDYRHKFLKQGRTLSMNFMANVSDNNKDTYNDYINLLFDTPDNNEEKSSQYKDYMNKEQKYRGNIMYTEPLSKEVMLQANYRIYYQKRDADNMTYEKSSASDLYDLVNEDLSNIYESDYLTQSGGLGLRFHFGKLNASAEANMQYSSLINSQTYPMNNLTDKSFFAVLPRFNLRYAVDRNNSFMLRYNSKSNSPSINNLQNVIDNSNPMFVTGGNPLLDQEIEHHADLRYTLTTKSGHSFIAMIGGTIKSGYIADSTFVATEEVTLKDGITLDKGAQFTKPTNLDGYYSLQSLFTYGFPVDFIRSNLNFSIMTNYASIPTIFDGKKSNTNELSIVPKVIIGSNISTKLDFTLSYSAGINKAFNSLANTQADNYINHAAQFKFGWEFWKGFTLQSTLNYVGYTGLEDGNQNYYLWNASLSKKFLKNNAAEISLSAFDLLRQNMSFARNVGSNYYEYVNGNVLEPYFMLSFTYNLR